MTYGGDGMMQEHARSRIAHDLANLLALCGRIAVRGAIVARSLGRHMRAVLGAAHGKSVKPGALRADGLTGKAALRPKSGIMMSAAI